MDPVEILMHWLAKNYSKLILLAVVLIVAALIDKALTKVVRRMLDKSQVPNASIFVNILRVVVWGARMKLKGIDGGPHKRWSMWFNSKQREEPYQVLTPFA